jgi:hypothetical protein
MARHVFYRQYPGNNSFIAVPSHHFVAYLDFALLGYIYPHDICPWRQFVALFSRKYADIYDAPFSPLGTSQELSRTSRAFSQKSPATVFLLAAGQIHLWELLSRLGYPRLLPSSNSDNSLLI